MAIICPPIPCSAFSDRTNHRDTRSVSKFDIDLSSKQASTPPVVLVVILAFYPAPFRNGWNRGGGSIVSSPLHASLFLHATYPSYSLACTPELRQIVNRNVLIFRSFFLSLNTEGIYSKEWTKSVLVENISCFREMNSEIYLQVRKRYSIFQK